MLNVYHQVQSTYGLPSPSWHVNAKYPQPPPRYAVQSHKLSAAYLEIYFNIKEKWAIIFEVRITIQITTNKYIESFHKEVQKEV